MPGSAREGDVREQSKHQSRGKSFVHAGGLRVAGVSDLDEADGGYLNLLREGKATMGASAISPSAGV